MNTIINCCTSVCTYTTRHWIKCWSYVISHDWLEMKSYQMQMRCHKTHGWIRCGSGVKHVFFIWMKCGWDVDLDETQIKWGPSCHLIHIWSPFSIAVSPVPLWITQRFWHTRHEKDEDVFCRLILSFFDTIINTSVTTL